MLEVVSLQDVLRLVAAGEDFSLNGASTPLSDLVAVAEAVGRSKASVRFKGLSNRPIEDLMRIMVASQGRAILDYAQLPADTLSPKRRFFSWRGPQIAKVAPVGAFS